MDEELFNNASWLIASIMRQLMAMPDDTPGVMDVLTRIAEQDLSEENFSPQAPSRLAACRHLPQAVASGLIVSADVCSAIAAVEDQMHWQQTSHYSDEVMGQSGYMDNYTSSEIIGPKGLFAGDDFAMGLMLLGPGLHYIDHHHAAPELYWLLTGPIEFRRAPGGFQEIGTASTIWNEPGQVHAMKTGDAPLLCVWAWTREICQPPVLVQAV